MKKDKKDPEVFLYFCEGDNIKKWHVHHHDDEYYELLRDHNEIVSNVNLKGVL